MTLFNRRSRRVNPDELLRQANDSLALTRAQQPKVTFITNWLEARKDQNGFGDDFEYTLRPKGAS